MVSLGAERYPEQADTPVAEPAAAATTAGSIWILFAMVAAGLLCTALVGAATSWDGAYYLFKILQTRAPFVPHHRQIVVPLHDVVVLVSYMTSNIHVIETVFTLVYAVLPLLALACSWWVVRSEAPLLFVWAAFGIGISTLPGQFAFITEANTAAQFFLPIALAILTRLHRRQIPIVIASTLIVFFSHPTAIVVFGMAAGLAALVGWRDREHRRSMWCWAGGYGVICVVAFVRFLTTETSYEADQLTSDSFGQTFSASVAGFPLIALLCGGLAGIMVVLAPFVLRSRARRFIYVIYAIELACMVVAGAVLLIWASNSYWWRGLLGYRRWMLPSMLPFVAFATLESLWYSPTELRVLGQDWLHRMRTMQVTGLIYLVVLFGQSLAWYNATQELTTALADRSSPCISTSSIGWLYRTPLDNWSVSPRSILLQGQTPQKIVLEGAGCSQNNSKGIPITSWDVANKQSGWFDLEHLARQLGAGELPQ